MRKKKSKNCKEIILTDGENNNFEADCDEQKSLKTRIIQKNLVYLIGLPVYLANEKVFIFYKQVISFRLFYGPIWENNKNNHQ